MWPLPRPTPPFPGWAATPPSERQRLFLKAADIVERRRSDIASMMAVEAGTCGAFAGYQVKLVADQLRHASGWGFKPIGDVIPSDVPGRLALAVRKPLGVVAGFSPWNGAFTLAWRTVLLPMVFGNTVVLKAVGRGAAVGRAADCRDHGRGRLPARHHQRRDACAGRGSRGRRRLL